MENFIKKEEIKLNGLSIASKLTVREIEIPNISGGFGRDKKSMLVMHIAEIHEKLLKHVNQIINDNRKRFKDYVDIIDVKTDEEFVVALTDHKIMTKMQAAKANSIYLLSERGYAKLIKLFNDDKSWDLYDIMLDEYFDMRDGNIEPINNTPMSMEDIIIHQMQQAKETKRKFLEQQQELNILKDNVVDMKSYLVESPDFKMVQHKINSFARNNSMKQSEVWNAVYRKVEDKYGIDVNQRVKNRRKKIQEEREEAGIKPYAESTLRSKVNGMDIIREEKLERIVLEILSSLDNEMK